MSDTLPAPLPGPNAEDDDHYEYTEAGSDRLVICDPDNPVAWVKSDFYGTLEDVR